MQLFLTLAVSFLTLFSTAKAQEFNPFAGRILFLLHQREITDAITLYQKSIQGSEHNHEVLDQICGTLLEQGFRSDDPEIQLTTIFGASVAASEKTFFIAEEAIQSSIPQIQLAGLSLLSRSHDENNEDILRPALRSPFLILRLEALFLLAENKNPKTSAYAESLMAIVTDELLPVFPEIFALVGDGHAKKALQKLISHRSQDVRLATILALVKQQRDDFLPKIRLLATHSNPKQLEACAYAFGVLKDESAIMRLKELAHSPHNNVKLAALVALHKLGLKEVSKQIESLALQEDLFAISALKELPGTEDTLAYLMKSASPHVRVNATLSLLEKKDSRSLPGLKEILHKDSRDYAFTKILSDGHTAIAWKVVPSALQRSEESPSLLAVSLQIKELALTKALELSEDHFLLIAASLLEGRQNDLVPSLVSLLENKQTPGAISLLNHYRQKEGAPLIRQYCNLALFRMKEEGSSPLVIREWIFAHMKDSLFHFKAPKDPSHMETGSNFTLTPDQTSKLLIESIEAIAKTQNSASIDILLELIKNGNPANRYVLAGLLMRVAQ